MVWDSSSSGGMRRARRRRCEFFFPFLSRFGCLASERGVGNGNGEELRADKFGMDRLEEAQEPETLSQETIIDNMSSDEWARLSRVRNIGIAVGFTCGFALTGGQEGKQS